jgi:hypothetical protein
MRWIGSGEKDRRAHGHKEVRAGGHGVCVDILQKLGRQRRQQAIFQELKP